jgi:4-hydroxy-tetrahydrodipicolinate reductase
MRTIVSGACGRTGSLVACAIERSGELTLAGAVEARGSEAVGRVLSDVLPGCAASAPVRESLKDFRQDEYDVIVDFSVPEQSALCAEVAGLLGKALVVGTTGLSDRQRSAVKSAAVKSAVVLASNMSVGANVLFALLAQATAALGPRFDIEVVEAHHRNKVDAPSGTALRIVDVIAEARGSDRRSLAKLGRSGATSTRTPGEIGVHSIRGGATAGHHSVHFLSNTETLTLEHEALSREAFADGAVRAAVFAGSSPPGLYDMMDVLGLTRGAGCAGGGRS